MEPYYNYKTETKRIYCAQHKKINMIDVKNKRKCLRVNCLKRPSFNFDSENKGIHDIDHIYLFVFDVINKRKCIEENFN
jgi:hypothetical protein